MPLRAVLAALLVAGLFPSVAGAHEPRCVDAVVVARVVDQDYEPIPEAPPGTFIMRWTWKLQLDVEQVVLGSAGTDEMPATMILHSALRPGPFLFVLRKNVDGVYEIAEDSVGVIRDRKGKFIVPLAEPLREGHLRPEGLFPRQYEEWLKPVKYRARDAWWISYLEVTTPEDRAALKDSPWAFLDRGVVAAKRGLLIEDMDDILTAAGWTVCPA